MSRLNHDKYVSNLVASSIGRKRGFHPRKASSTLAVTTINLSVQKVFQQVSLWKASRYG